MAKHVGPPAPEETVRAALATLAVVAVIGVVIGALVLLRPAGGAAHPVDRAADIADVAVATGPASQPVRRSAPLHRTAAGKPQRVADAGKALRRKTQRAVEAEPTTFRVSTFNVLGASHTVAGGSKASGRWGSGVSRMAMAVGLLQSTGVDVVGLQELQPPQFNVLRARAPGWGSFPASGSNRMSMANSIAWNEDVWEFQEGHFLMVPYFHGQPVAMPYVLLRNRDSGRSVWFFNTHNPADAHGPAQHWRDVAVAREAALFNQLTSGGTPVVVTGDMNDREQFFCPVTARTSLHAAKGGSTGTACAPPPAMNVDWILGSEEITFSGFVATKGGAVPRITDHPFVYADASLPPEPAGSTG